MAAALPLEEAQARLLALATPLPVEHVAVGDTVGLYLAEPLTARRTQPAADLSAMDGYAIRASCLPGPWRVVGESAAGHPYPGVVAPGEAVRIATGALVPAGADAVVVQEDCIRTEAHLALTGTPPSPAGRHIRRRATDFAEGVSLLPAGTRIGPPQIALALSAGHTHLPVRRLPRLAIIDSGDELAAPGEACPPHRIPASNGAMLAALAASIPCVIERLGPVPDDLSRLTAALEAGAGADIIVTSGGASVGDHDLIRPALAACGANLDFWRVAIKPGKPLLVATRGGQVIVGLPGNPVASLVTGYFFLLPLLRRLLGASACLPAPVVATLATPLPAGGARREFRRALWDGATVRDGDYHDSGALASLALANCLIDRPADAPAAGAGDKESIYPLDNGGIA
jgi:molybdopterin molybdotransferase